MSNTYIAAFMVPHIIKSRTKDLRFCAHTRKQKGVLIAGEQASRTPSPLDRSVSCSTPPEFRMIGACGISGPPGHGQVGQWLLGASGELVRLEIIDINKAFKNGISSPESEMLPSRE